MSASHDSKKPQLTTATVNAQQQICRDHFKLTLGGMSFAKASPGQFVQLSPTIAPPSWDLITDTDSKTQNTTIQNTTTLTPALPFLPRAFSIGGLRRNGPDCEIDIIYRVVGVATKWLASLRLGDRITLLGPLGRAFTMPANKPITYLVGGGVGVPPLLWFSETLNKAKVSTTAFIGSTTKDFLPLGHHDQPTPCADATEARFSAVEFANTNTPVVISTDDGSMGFRGNVVEALEAHITNAEVNPSDVVVYTCGPEGMMRGVSKLCATMQFKCYVCMERAMACGVGTCQSCVVSVRSEEQRDWRYALCCTEGPVFDSTQILWDR